MDRFCPKCGSKGKTLIKNLCETCFWDQRVSHIPNNLIVKLCRSCLSYLQGKKWVRIRKKDPNSVALEGAINELKRNITIPKDTKILKIEGGATEWNLSGLPKKVVLDITLTSEGASSSLKREATVEYITCDFCQSVASGKYEALVQIRGEEGQLSEESRKTVESSIDKFYRNVLKDRSDITEIQEKDGGIDIKFLTSSKARLFAKKLSEITGADLKETAKIMGTDRMTGKRHYRTTISVKLPALEPGDLVSFKERIFKVLGHHRGKLILEDVEDHKRRSLSQRATADVAKIDKTDIKRVSIGARSGSTVTILDLEEKRFLELPSEKISGDLKEGDVGLLINLDGKEKVIRRQ